MNENIYSAPESNTSRADDFIKSDSPIFLGIFDRPMLFAVAIQIAITSILSTVSFFNPQNMSLPNIFLGFIFDVFWAFFLVYLIRKLRGNKKYSRKNPSVYETIGTWGYLWRSFIAKYVSFLLMLILLALFSMAAKLESPSIAFTVLSFGLSIVASIVIVCLFFSNNRAGQFKWLLTIFRGY